MQIKKKRLIIEGTLDPFYSKRDVDAILFFDTKTYLLEKNSSYQSKNKDINAIFKYKTSFKFKEIEFLEAVKIISESTEQFVMGCAEVSFLANFPEKNRTIQVAHKVSLLNSMITQMTLELSLDDRNTEQPKIKL